MTKPDPGPGEEPEGLQRLPPGRHGLPREFVTQNQRDRLAAAIIACAAERGYHETTITQIAAAAGLSRRTFYGYFKSKEECFFDAYQLIEDHLAEVLEEAANGKRGFAAKVRAQLGALLETFAANPDLVRFSLIAPASAGGEFLDRYRSFLERLVAIVSDGHPSTRVGSERAEATTMATAGGLAALLASKVKAGEGEALPELLPDLTELLLAPYVGRKRAAAEARR
ncbi:MAG: TetR/AcrR family transcriptional regulator [Solirubrobacterales bacterium]